MNADDIDLTRKCESKTSDPWWCVTHDSKWDLVKQCEKVWAALTRIAR